MTNNLGEPDDDWQAVSQAFENWVDEQLQFGNPHQWSRPEVLLADHRRWALKHGKAPATPEQFVSLLVENFSVQTFNGKIFIGCVLREAPPQRHRKATGRNKNAIRR